VPNYNLIRFDPDTGLETPQWLFHHSRMPIQFFGGAFANGKTTALVVKALKLCENYPGSNGLLARATYPQLNDTLRKTFMEWIPSGWVKRRPSQDDNTCYLTNGTVVNFRYIAQRGKQQADGTTTSNLLSATYDWIGVDQLEDPGIVYKDFLDLIGRLRGTTRYRPNGPDDDTMPSSGPRWLMLTANPTGNWVYKQLIAPYIMYRDRGIKTDSLLIDAKTGLPIIELYEGSTYTNRHNLTPDFIRNLETTYRGQMRARYLIGEWKSFEGLVYSTFDRNINLITREQAMAHLNGCHRKYVALKVVESYDFGLVSPTCYIFAFVDNYGRVFIMDGFYEPNLDYSRHPKKITEIRDKYSEYLEVEDPIYADPDIFRRKVVGSRASATSVANLLSDLGLEMRPAANDISNGIAKVASYINGRDDTPHIITGNTPGPLLYVVDDLTWFSDEIFSYYWKKSPQGNHVDEPVDENDHAMDATKYLLTKLPDPSEIVIPSNVLPPKWSFWHEAPDNE
jgi:hypothetical protein